MRRTLDRARDQGFTFFAAPEIEYFYFADPDPSMPPVTLDTGSYFELTATDVASDLRKRTVLTLEEMGIPVEHAQHEDAPSQHEIDLRYTDALTMADTVMTVRLVVKETAQRTGRARQLHAQAAGRRPGLGHAHPPVAVRGRHQRLLRPRGPRRAVRGGQAVHRRPAPPRPRDHGRHQPVGQLLQAPGRPATRPRSTCRGPATTARPWSGCRSSSATRYESTRIEYRAPDTACNPYLAFAVILAAGLKGIEEGYELPREAAANLFAMTPEELAAEGIRPLPGSLNEAVAEMERSELVAETLGEHVFEWFIRNKRAEWARVQDPHQPVRARPLPAAALGADAALDGAAHTGDTTADGAAAVLPRAVPRRAGPRPRAGRLPVEGHRPARARRVRRARGRLGRGGGLRRAPTPPAPSPCAGWCAPATSPCARCCSWSGPTQLGDLQLREDHFDDFCVLPATPRGARGPPRPPLLAHGPRAARRAHRARPAGPQPRDLPGGGGRPVLDLTYMEYELLRFLAARPGKVFTRETLLSRVWGYEYYGGARTVDVHVRRLRAKLGEEHAHLIETVRSVGYRFGHGTWTP